MDTGKNIWIQKSSRVIKGLIVSYLVSGAGLLLLALLLLKYQLDERKVSAGILAVYILSGLSGGIYMGKYMENESLDFMVSAIVNKALEEYKQKLIENVEKYYENRYCAKAGTVKVATKNEIIKIIDRTVME